MAVVVVGVECRHHRGGSLLRWSSKYLSHVQNSEQERSANVSFQEENDDNDETIQEETVVVTSGVKQEEMGQKDSVLSFVE